MVDAGGAASGSVRLGVGHRGLGVAASDRWSGHAIGSGHHRGGGSRRWCFAWGVRDAARHSAGRLPEDFGDSGRVAPAPRLDPG